MRYLYRARDRVGKELGPVKVADPVGPGDTVLLQDGREAVVSAVIGPGRGSQLAGVLEVVVQ